MTGQSPNTVWAETLVGELACAGVQHACVAPGSRSTPLILAVAAHPDVRVYTHLDERSAGFFALGLAKATRRPAVVITTSGTAGANLLPAVVEASQADVPLIAITADRPPRLRTTDANQTVDQTRLFGTFPRAFFEVPTASAEERPLRALRMLAARAVSAAAGTPAGPVHLNVPFEKPLEPVAGGGKLAAPTPPHADREGGAPFTRIAATRRLPGDAEFDRLTDRLAGARRCLLVAGPVAEPDRAGPAFLELAERGAHPLLADPLSGARFCRGARRRALAHYDAFLRIDAVERQLRPDLVLRFGASPTSSAVAAYLERLAAVPQIVIDDGSRWMDHIATAGDYVRADPGHVASALAARGAGSSERAWAPAWCRVDQEVGAALRAEIDREPFEPRVVAQIVAALPAGSTLVVGNSMPIRDLDRFGAARDDAIRIHGNRGASGIDGVVSTALGVAAGSRTPIVALLGDVSFLHDLNGLFAAREAGVAVVFVVINNDGGGIFHSLPVREFEPAFTRHIVVPHGLDLARAAALYAIGHVRMATDGSPAEAVADALRGGGTVIIEVTANREDAQRRHAECLAAVGTTVRAFVSGDEA